jgi:hypothetical protein
MNTITNNKDFGGRRVLDKSVKDRFHTIYVEGDIESRYKKSTIAYKNAVDQLLRDKGITNLVSPRDMKRFEHMIETTKIDKEVAIRKCLIGNKTEVTDDVLRKIVKEGVKW